MTSRCFEAFPIADEDLVRRQSGATWPGIGTSGYSVGDQPLHMAAKGVGYDVVISKHRWTGNGQAMIVCDAGGLVEIITEQEDGTGVRTLDVRHCGPWATVQFGRGSLAATWEATVDEAAHLVQPRPGPGELFGGSALAMTALLAPVGDVAGLAVAVYR